VHGRESLPAQLQRLDVVLEVLPAEPETRSDSGDKILDQVQQVIDRHRSRTRTYGRKTVFAAAKIRSVPHVDAAAVRRMAEAATEFGGFRGQLSLCCRPPCAEARRRQSRPI